MRLKDKVIVVTGSSRGIGRGIVERCVEEGARVLVHGLEGDLVEEVCGILGRESAEGVVADLTVEGSVERVVAAAVARFGRMDGLVNNAGKVGVGNVGTTDGALFDAFMAVNVRAPYLLIRAALSELEKVGGSVVNIGSVNAYSGEPDLLPYSISKGALMTLTRNLGDTLHRERGVRVNQVNPGWVLTEQEMVRKREEGMGEEWWRGLPDVYAPSGRLFAPREMAEAVVYFLSDAAGPVSGSVMDVEQHPFIGRNPPKV